MRLSVLVRAPSRGSFFTPSYLTRPATPRTITSRSINFSSNSSNSSRHGSGSNRIKQPSTSAARPSPSSSHLSKSTSSTSASATTPPTTTTVSVKRPITLLAPTLPHASKNLVMYDRFFALHRPLLELPIRITARKTVAPAARLWSPMEDAHEVDEESRAEENEREEIEKFGRDASLASSREAEVVHVVDLGPDGVTPHGEPYIATVSGVEAIKEEPLPSEEDMELVDLEHEATEAAIDDMANGLPDPYEPWLIGTQDDALPPSPAVSRYLATHPPFVAPPAPASSVPASGSRSKSSSTSSWTASQVLSDISFLRPFPTSPTTSPADSALNPAFASHFLDPLPSGLASQVADQFLSSAILSHRFNAHNDYATSTGEALELARRSYAEPSEVASLPRRVAFETKRERGEVRMWNEESGWVTVDLGKGRADGSPFLSAEMVDLDWEEEELERETLMSRIQMDSVKRKRKKKITKHKYKKRRKAQQALRQRLGK
ncbi:hypothetical protein P7C70_g586, partial [Phenoliferia sp. Uapishka_3]